MQCKPPAGRPDGGFISVLYFQHALPIGLFIVFLVILITMLGITWAIAKNDIGGGFGIASYAIAVPTLAVTFYIGVFSLREARRANMKSMLGLV